MSVRFIVSWQIQSLNGVKLIRSLHECLSCQRRMLMCPDAFIKTRIVLHPVLIFWNMISANSIYSLLGWPLLESPCSAELRRSQEEGGELRSMKNGKVGQVLQRRQGGVPPFSGCLSLVLSRVLPIQFKHWSLVPYQTSKSKQTKCTSDSIWLHLKYTIVYLSSSIILTRGCGSHTLFSVWLASLIAAFIVLMSLSADIWGWTQTFWVNGKEMQPKLPMTMTSPLQSATVAIAAIYCLVSKHHFF